MQDLPLDELIKLANATREENFKDAFDLCSIVNVKNYPMVKSFVWLHSFKI